MTLSKEELSRNLHPQRRPNCSPSSLATSLWASRSHFIPQSSIGKPLYSFTWYTASRYSVACSKDCLEVIE
uniref:Uncharacterized protein n=1 Tax=Arcella intermedia TaxID=1963864 RepID=A0A6B2LTE3_9EUKA